MTLFGIIWILLTIIAFYKSDVKYILTLTLFGMVFQSNNVVVLGGVTGIGPQFFSCGAFIIKSLTLKGKRINNYFKIFFFVLFTFLIYITFNSAFISKEGFNLIQVMMLWVYFITLYRLAKISYKIQYGQAVTIYRKLVVFVLIIGFILMVQMIGLLPDVGITETLFYNDTIGDCYYQDPEMDHSRFTASFLEPSYCAAFLVGALYFFMIIERGNKQSLKLLIPIITAVLLTRSSTAFGALGIAGIIYIFSKGNKKILRSVLPISFVIIIVLFPLFSKLLDQVIFSKSETGSAMVRANYNLEAMSVFMNNRLFGQGYGTQRASSIIPTILAELGIVGFVLYSIMALTLLYMTIFKKGVPQHYYGSSFIVISAVISQMIACPDFSLCTYWLALCLMALFVGCNNSSVNININLETYKI